MPQNYSGRITLIVAVLLLALISIFPPQSLTAPSLSQKLNLKPGIDMVGGTSLLYEIKPPEGTAATADLSERVMEALKRRVDPDGVRNLIWRPQGGNRLEIQMPMSASSETARVARQEYTVARDQLVATNVRPGEILNIVEHQAGEARRKQLDKLAMGWPTRQKFFASLAETYDLIEKAKKTGDAKLQGEKENEYDDLKGKIGESNLSVNDLEAVLSTSRPETRDKKLGDLKKKYADFPARLAAMDRFARAFTAFDAVKGSIDDAGELKRLLKGSGVLEFHILVTDLAAPEAQEMIRRLHQKGPGIEAGDTMRWFTVDRPEEFQRSTQIYNERHWVLAYITPDKSMDNRGGKARWALERAFPTQSQSGLRVVGFRFNPQGAKYFSDLTGNNIGKPLAIMLDDKVISAPNINSQIGAEGIIEGGEKGYTDQELGYLINTLNAGSLPAQLADEPISERTVEAQLGAENLRAGLMACVVGLVIVAIFLIGYYYLAGVVATFAVLMNVVLILGSMAALNATFTLPGIAGIVLTIGAAVDANVLIFERLREEQHRGLSLRMALRNAYDRAFSAILDSNVTTIITAVVLYGLGSEEVKGFGLTLLIGLVWSLFTALFVTKTIFGLMVDKLGVKHLGSFPLTFPKWDQMLKPNIDWMRLAWVFIAFSVAFTVAGVAAFVVKANQRELLDIEFAGGTSVQFELKQPMAKTELEKLVASRPQALPGANVLKIGGSQKEYEIVTPNTDSVSVKDAVLDALKGKLALQVPSKFEHVDESIDTAMGSAVQPIENDTFSVDKTFVPRGVQAHMGGVAIVLKNLDPALKPSEIKARIEQQRLQPQAGETTQAYREFDVEGAEPGDTPTNTAVVLASDPALPYAKDAVKWRDELAGPMWKLVNEAVNKPPQLQKVSNFGAQVAGDTQRDALMAMTLSLAVIMAYIWLRFGNMKYGTATVVAMLHDTLLVIGAIGLSHYLADTAIGKMLLIDPFRVNLTIVAAVLTVMSYSMIDTIVVFDRVRENRGKYGHLDRGVINDSINQTLSRTLLTGGTNICTVLVMYIMGGPGIHGFTFVLLVGILVGTYSSIAIAAPMLLVGVKKQPGTSAGKPSAGAVQKL